MDTTHKADFHDKEGGDEPLLSYMRNLEERVIPYIIVGAVSLSFLFAGAFIYRTVSSLQDELAAERQARIELQTTVDQQQQEINALREQLTLTPEQVARAKQEAHQEEAMQDIYDSIGRATRALLTP